MISGKNVMESFAPGVSRINLESRENQNATWNPNKSICILCNEEIYSGVYDPIL